MFRPGSVFLIPSPGIYPMFAGLAASTGASDFVNSNRFSGAVFRGNEFSVTETFIPSTTDGKAGPAGPLVFYMSSHFKISPKSSRLEIRHSTTKASIPR